uniref:Uncharacterized protein n=1 Tax=Timema cristinae TaxID=61476 RepID=A0A7R9D6G3_TIMCR|nr:unnamed protein product [Timema cristinae]
MESREERRGETLIMAATLLSLTSLLAIMGLKLRWFRARMNFSSSSSGSHQQAKDGFTPIGGSYRPINNLFDPYTSQSSTSTPQTNSQSIDDLTKTNRPTQLHSKINSKSMTNLAQNSSKNSQPPNKNESNLYSRPEQTSQPLSATNPNFPRNPQINSKPMKLHPVATSAMEVSQPQSVANRSRANESLYFLEDDDPELIFNTYNKSPKGKEVPPKIKTNRKMIHETKGSKPQSPTPVAMARSVSPPNVNIRGPVKARLKSNNAPPPPTRDGSTLTTQKGGGSTFIDFDMDESES